MRDNPNDIIDDFDDQQPINNNNINNNRNFDLQAQICHRTLYCVLCTFLMEIIVYYSILDNHRSQAGACPQIYQCLLFIILSRLFVVIYSIILLIFGNSTLICCIRTCCHGLISFFLFAFYVYMFIITNIVYFNNKNQCVEYHSALGNILVLQYCCVFLFFCIACCLFTCYTNYSQGHYRHELNRQNLNYGV